MPRVAKSVDSALYRPVVLEALKEFLPAKIFLDLPAGQRLWRGWEMVLAAVLLAWESGGSLARRFEGVSLTFRQWWPKKPLGRTYQGFIKALLRHSPALLDILTPALQAAMRSMAGPFWRRQGYVAFAVDGSRLDCPRTADNEKKLGCAGRNKTGPQIFLTTLYHMGTGLPWAFRRGPGTDSERTHLRDMVGSLPDESLLVADAGFIGYDLLATLLQGGRHVLFRVGRNVTLLRNLGWAVEQRDDTVYLWPAAAQKHSLPPLALRLIVVGQGRAKVFLLTDLPEESLSQEQADVLYRLRWGVEVFYRSLKQTLERRRMLSRAPQQALHEADWSMIGLWLLGLMSVRQIIARGGDPLGLSVALAVRQVRLALRQNRRSIDGQWLARRLGRALKDGYQRTRPRKARNWPHKKRERPPGEPRIMIATTQQISLAQRL